MIIAIAIAAGLVGAILNLMYDRRTPEEKIRSSQRALGYATGLGPEYFIRD